MKSYRDLEIYCKAFELAYRVHEMTMTLPKYEMYEQGSQIRRSSKSIKDNIAEGFGRKKYKAEFVRFLIFAHSSCDETMSQLEMISKIHFKTNPLTKLISDYKSLSKQLYRFIEYIETKWQS